ncbi:hypothetical protein F753_03715 [Stutzerimonas chloritidismutans AW-1]|uniref:Uncharacterized protein n=1 Tax=Stutzerimonas chloritidismutans AW-1 TaxID=1263865 RepID=V4S7G9_STUCH|nr:hypothetical protein F753_03715 [Stutzerimonas chloritidismutans AW-1]CEG53183.1 hypothetical protein PXNS11_290087 [Stutzerimonas xanthomarina]
MPFVALAPHVVPLNMGLQPLDGIAFMADVQESAESIFGTHINNIREPRSTDVGS